MKKESFSEHAFVGEYGGKEYVVLFDGMLVLPRNGYCRNPLDAWDEMNEFFKSFAMRDLLPPGISFDSPNMGNVILTKPEPGSVEYSEISVYNSDFEDSLDSFLFNNLNGWVTDINKVREVAKSIAEKHTRANIKKFGSELEADLGGTNPAASMAAAICGALPPSIRSQLPEDDVLAALTYATNMLGI